MSASISAREKPRDSFGRWQSSEFHPDTMAVAFSSLSKRSLGPIPPLCLLSQAEAARQAQTPWRSELFRQRSTVSQDCKNTHCRNVLWPHRGSSFHGLFHTSNERVLNAA